MCSIFLIIDDNNETVRFAGFTKESSPPQCPKCHRLFPLAKPLNPGNRWVEIFCTREDEHERNGEHWHQHGDIRLSWIIPSDAAWMATVACEVTKIKWYTRLWWLACRIGQWIRHGRWYSSSASKSK